MSFGSWFNHGAHFVDTFGVEVLCAWRNGIQFYRSSSSCSVTRKPKYWTEIEALEASRSLQLDLNCNENACRFNMHENGIAQLAIYNMVGQKIVEQKITGQKEGAIHFPQTLRPGCYIAHIRSADRISSQKFLIE